MPNIHYFQRYSSRENAVTNNTLQLIYQIYGHSVSKFDIFFRDLLGDNEISVGLEISQQSRAKDSVPDGLIIQRGFKILLETKVNSGINVAQLLNHSSDFKSTDGTKQILLLLTKDSLSDPQKADITSKIRESNPGVQFASVTYKDICNSLEGLFQEYDSPIYEIAEDYKAYCRDMGLMDNINAIMRVVPTGDSFDLNKAYSIYFQPSDRGYASHTYIGMYRDKAVRVIGKVTAVFDVSYAGEQFTKDRVAGEDTDRFDERLRSIILEAQDKLGWDVRVGHRFFCMDEIAETNFVKDSPHGIQGARFFNLADYAKNLDSGKAIAASLRDKSWKEGKLSNESVAKG